MKTKQTTIAKEWDWEKEIDRAFYYYDSPEAMAEAFDTGEIHRKMYDIIAQTRATTLDACLAVIGEDEKEDALNEGTRYNVVRNNLRQELRQAINSLQVTNK